MRRTTADRVVDLHRVEPGQRLIQQQHAGPGGERPRHLEQLALVEVDPAGSASAWRARPTRSRCSSAATRASEGPRLPAPNMIAIATLSRTVIEPNGRGIW